MSDKPLATFEVVETGRRRLELIGRTASSSMLLGGMDGEGFTSGPGPHELLCAALSACTAMTMRLFAEKEAISVTNIEVSTSYHHGTRGDPGRFDRVIHVEGALSDEQREKLLRAGEGCPVGRALRESSVIDIAYRNALVIARSAQAVS